MGKRSLFVDYDKLLGNWNTLNENLMGLSEQQVGRLLTYEKHHNNRITFILRLHSRLNKLRRERERRVLVKGKV